MGKFLASMGIVGAVFAMMAALILVDAAVFIVVVVALVGSIGLLAQRNLTGAIAGIVILACAIIATLGLLGSITTESGSTDFGISEASGRVWAIVACLAIPMGALAVRWSDLEPRWLTYATAAAGALTAIMALAVRANLTDQSNIAVLLTGVLALTPLGAMIVLLRGPEPPMPAA